MRVTQSILDRDLLYAISSNLERLARLNEQISSGQRVNTISDDVPATGRILQLNRENAQLDTYLANTDLADGMLSVATSTLGSVSETVASIRELAVQAATETYTDADRQIMAEGIDNLLATLVSLANAQYSGQYVFSGEGTQTAPFQVTTDVSGNVTAVAYQGEPIATDAAVGPGTTTQVNLVGSAVFQQDADLFESVIGLRDAVRASDADEINRYLGEVADSHDHVRQYLGRLGERQNQLQFSRATLEQLQLFNHQTLADTQDADITELTVQYNSTMALLQMVMETAAYAVKPSLFDFL